MGKALPAVAEGYYFDQEHGSVPDFHDKEYVDCTAHLSRSPMHSEMHFIEAISLLSETQLNQ